MWVQSITYVLTLILFYTLPLISLNMDYSRWITWCGFYQRSWVQCIIITQLNIPINISQEWSNVHFSDWVPIILHKRKWFCIFYSIIGLWLHASAIKSYLLYLYQNWLICLHFKPVWYMLQIPSHTLTQITDRSGGVMLSHFIEMYIASHLSICYMGPFYK